MDGGRQTDGLRGDLNNGKWFITYSAVMCKSKLKPRQIPMVIQYTHTHTHTHRQRSPHTNEKWLI